MPTSLASTARTADRERLRDKARRLQMHENLRLAVCARLQQQLRKPPRLADELATPVLLELRRRGLGADASDAELAAVVRDLSAQPRRHDFGPHAQPTAREEPQTEKKASGRRSSDSSKNRLMRKQPAKGAPSNNDAGKGPFVTDKPEADAYVTETQLQQRSTGFSLPPRVSPKRERDSGIWEQIVKFSSVEEQREAERKRALREQQREELSVKLAAQLEAKQQQKQQERQLSAEFHRQTVERLRSQDELERNKERDRLERAKALTQIQKQQRDTKAQQVEREKDLRRQQEERAAALLRKQREDDQARERARKEAEKKRVELVQAENEQQLARKREEREREHARDMQLAEQYVKMEEAKEAARRAQLDALAQSIQKKMKVFDDTAKADMDSRAKEEEERVRKYQREYAEQQAQREREKKEQAEERSLAQQEFLRKQMTDKRAREEDAKREMNKQAELWKQERVEAERRERLAAQQRNARNHSQQEVLREQIREREARSLAADQSALELQLNAGLLDKIHRQSGVVSDTQSRSRQLQQQEEASFEQRRGSGKR